MSEHFQDFKRKTNYFLLLASYKQKMSEHFQDLGRL